MRRKQSHKNIVLIKIYIIVDAFVALGGNSDKSGFV